MALEVFAADGLVTVQDLGRTSWGRFGVPRSGPMDAFALRAANALAGNPLEAAVLEIGLGDAVFRPTQDCVIAVTGAGYALSSYVWDFPLWVSLLVRGGWTVRLNKSDGGNWAYLAVAGGIETPLALGSRSAYLRGGLGGRIETGDILPVGRTTLDTQSLAARTLPEAFRPAYTQSPLIEVIPGPQTDRFTANGIKTFLSGCYRLSPASDRMGYRLDGPKIEHSGSADLLSEGMAIGSIQVPASGQPIAMMADSPTTGGYPKIAGVVSADLPVLAQCAPGQAHIRFRETTIVVAQARWRAMVDGLYTGIVKI
jgi:antagonist of KipI